MPKTQIIQKYGWFPTEKERAYDHALTLEWARADDEYNDGHVVVGLQKRFVKQYTSVDNLDRVGQVFPQADGTFLVVVRTEEEKIGLSRREINNLIGDLKRARSQAFGEDK